MNQGGIKPGEDPGKSTNRRREDGVLARYIDATDGVELPILMFYGAGATALSMRLDNTLQEKPFTTEPIPLPLPSVHLDLQARNLGACCQRDPAIAYAEIRRQFAVECPAFDLAYAMLRGKQGVRDEAAFRHGGAFHTAWEFLEAAKNCTAHSVTVQDLLSSALDQAAERTKSLVRATPLGSYLLSAQGQQDFLHLRALDADALYSLLPERLGKELDARLPKRAGKACRGVVRVDIPDAIVAEPEHPEQQYDRLGWILDLFSDARTMLIVLAGRDRLNWEEVDEAWRDPAFLEQHPASGLSRRDAEEFIAHRGVEEERIREAVLRASLDMDAMLTARSEPVSYDSFRLGLCVDSIACERSRGNHVDPESFDGTRGDDDRLAARFLRSLGSADEADWIVRLALPGRFDEVAARTAFSPQYSAAQHAAWERLKNASFLAPPDEEGWYTFTQRMREALCRLLADPDLPYDIRRGHAEWRSYWKSRAQTATDECAELAWIHWWHLQPDRARLEWVVMAIRARNGIPPNMALHYRLIHWWLSIDLEKQRSPTAADALSNMSTELQQASVGHREQNLRQAIMCCEAALQVHTEERFPRAWAGVQSSLAIAHTNLSSGDLEENITRAIAGYEGALRVHTEGAFPLQWAECQNNLAIAFRKFSHGGSAENLKRAIFFYKEALRIRTEEAFPQEWAAAQQSLAQTYSSLSTGQHTENLNKAIRYCEAALRVFTESEFPQRWAAVQNAMASYYGEFSGGAPEDYRGRAILCCEAALRVRTEAGFPKDWAATQTVLAKAYLKLLSDDASANIQRAIVCYEAALRVYTETAFPLEWKITRSNLAIAKRRRLTHSSVFRMFSRQTYARLIESKERDGMRNSIAMRWKALLKPFLGP